MIRKIWRDRSFSRSSEAAAKRQNSDGQVRNSRRKRSEPSEQVTVIKKSHEWNHAQEINHLKMLSNLQSAQVDLGKGKERGEKGRKTSGGKERCLGR